MYARSLLTVQDIRVDSFGLDLPILFIVQKIWSVDLQENYRNYCHQMSDFKAIVHQIRFRLGLRPDPAA